MDQKIEFGRKDMLIKSRDLRQKLGGVSNLWLWRHVKDGKLPKPIKIAGRRFWLVGEIEAFLELQSVERGGGNG